jgi:hypothetical protein
VPVSFVRALVIDSWPLEIFYDAEQSMVALCARLSQRLQHWACSHVSAL